MMMRSLKKSQKMKLKEPSDEEEESPDRLQLVGDSQENTDED